MMLLVVQGMLHLKTQFYAVDVIGYSALRTTKLRMFLFFFTLLMLFRWQKLIFF